MEKLLLRNLYLVFTHLQAYGKRWAQPKNFCHDFSVQKQPPEWLKKNCFVNFVKFTGKHLCQSLFFNKVTGLRPATLLKTRPWCRCFPVNFATFLRTLFFTEHPWTTASDRRCWKLLFFNITLDCRLFLKP